MPTPPVSPAGQVPFPEDAAHLFGIKPGDKIELELLPDGRCLVRGVQSSELAYHLAELIHNQIESATETSEIEKPLLYQTDTRFLDYVRSLRWQDFT